jgi:hypothetical protein
MGLFTTRHDATTRPASTVPPQAPMPSAEAVPASTAAPGAGRGWVTDADLRTCDERLRPLETAIDHDNSPAANQAALALAVAGGYPSLTGESLFKYRTGMRAARGGDAYQEIDRKPWRWLAAIAATAASDTATERKLLAARIAFAAWIWRVTWKDRFAAEISPSAPRRIQFCRETGLIPPPEDLYASILRSGIMALGPITDKDTPIRDNRPWSAGGVTLLLARDLAAPDSLR